MSESGDERGQSNPLAIAIVLVLALTTALLITGVGGTTLDEGRQVAETQSGIRTMTELDSRASFVALNGGDSTTIDVSRRAGDGRVSVNESGEVRFVLRNTTTNSQIWKETFTLGTVTYSNGNSRVAYQGGGVWRRSVETNGSVMVAPPDVNYRGNTLTLPLIQVSGSDRDISTASVRKINESPVYPLSNSGRVNPVPRDRELVLYIQSDYYQAWGDFFRTRISGTNVTVFPGNRTVRVNLVSANPQFKIDSGLISVGTTAPIDMQGTGTSPTFVDSYNSSAGPYSSGNSAYKGNVRSPGGVDMGGNTYINGTVNTGGSIAFSGNDNTIYGDAFHTGVVQPQNGNITGVNETGGEGVTIPPIDTTSEINDICSNATQPLPDTDDTISNGKYCYTGDYKLNGETLTIDLNGGNVSIAITGDITLKSGAKIEVVNASNGDNVAARVWLGGDRVKITSSKVTVNKDRSPNLRLFAEDGTDIRLSGTGTPSEFTGLMFAPGGSGSFNMKSNSSLYGAAVVGEVKMQSGSSVHYDRALEGYSFERRNLNPNRLSYLYVTMHEIEIEER